MSEPIAEFRGEFYFLSNFYDTPVWYGGIRYPRSENAFQAEKTFNLEHRRAIAGMSARDAKHAGQGKLLMGQSNTLLVLREDWEEIKVPVMGEIVALKFIQNPELLRRLTATGNRTLIEGNWWHDTFWGVCEGEGKNWLGKILMDLRSRMWGVNR